MPLQEKKTNSTKYLFFLLFLGLMPVKYLTIIRLIMKMTKTILKKVTDKLQYFFVGDTHEAFESYKFHFRKQ